MRIRVAAVDAVAAVEVVVLLPTLLRLRMEKMRLLPVLRSLS
jgi:hypothetical protein